MTDVRGTPVRPQTQGKAERWHQTLKNRILLENYFLPGDREAQIEAFVDRYTTDDTTKASATRCPLTPTSAEHLPSSNSAKRSNDRPSIIGACSTESSRSNVKL